MAEDTTFNDMQAVKRRLFAMRNGIIADTLRKGGSPFKIIFGVNLPQLADIAKATAASMDDDEAARNLARRLWENTTTRESMLLAPMIMPAENFTRAEACSWISHIPCTEVADVLCHRLLRRLPFAESLSTELYESDDDIKRYTALRLMCNIARQRPQVAAEMGKAELKRGCATTRAVAMQLAEYDL